MDEPAMTGNVDADPSDESTDALTDEPADTLTDESTDAVDNSHTSGSTDGVPGATSAETHGARAALYGVLGGAFAYPTPEILAELIAPKARDGVEQAADRLGFQQPARALLEAMTKTTVEEQEAAYNNLFGLPESGAYPVVPYEGHYTTGSEVSEEQRRIATVVGLMNEFGVEPSADERQDHVAAELEFMQVVAAQRATALYRDDVETAGNIAAAEATILDTHLVGFVPAFARDLGAATSNEMYLAAADLATELVRTDHRWHSETAVETPGVSSDG